MQNDSTDLSARVRILERRLRRFGILAGLVGLALTTAAFAPTVREAVRATAFELVDDSGAVRG